MSSSGKRRITYTDLAYCKEGEGARVYIRNNGWFRTTPVIEIVPHCDGPVFETKNSIYWPAPTDGSPVDVYYQFKEKRSDIQHYSI